MRRQTSTKEWSGSGEFAVSRNGKAVTRIKVKNPRYSQVYMSGREWFSQVLAVEAPLPAVPTPVRVWMVVKRVSKVGIGSWAEVIRESYSRTCR